MGGLALKADQPCTPRARSEKNYMHDTAGAAGASWHMARTAPQALMTHGSAEDAHDTSQESAKGTHDTHASPTITSYNKAGREGGEPRGSIWALRHTLYSQLHMLVQVQSLNSLS